MERVCPRRLSNLSIQEITLLLLKQMPINTTVMCVKECLELYYICWFPVEYADNDSLFGGCSCGVPNTDDVPCQDMVAVVKSYRIVGLNENNVMPIWQHTSHWQKQYPWEQLVEVNFNTLSLRQSTAKIDESYVLCPPYTCP
jgi:hypothetical protein